MGFIEDTMCGMRSAAVDLVFWSWIHEAQQKTGGCGATLKDNKTIGWNLREIWSDSTHVCLLICCVSQPAELVLPSCTSLWPEVRLKGAKRHFAAAFGWHVSDQCSEVVWKRPLTSFLLWMIFPLSCSPNPFWDFQEANSNFDFPPLKCFKLTRVNPLQFAV